LAEEELSAIKPVKQAPPPKLTRAAVERHVEHVTAADAAAAGKIFNCLLQMYANCLRVMLYSWWGRSCTVVWSVSCWYHSPLSEDAVVHLYLVTLVYITLLLVRTQLYQLSLVNACRILLLLHGKIIIHLWICLL